MVEKQLFSETELISGNGKKKIISRKTKSVAAVDKYQCETYAIISKYLPLYIL